MRRIVLTATLMCGLALKSSADTVIFVDGTSMDVKSYEVKGAMVVLTTTDGKLRSVPAAYVNLDATEKANRRAGRSSEPPARSAAPATTSAPPPSTPARPPAPAPEVKSTTSAPAPAPTPPVEQVAESLNPRPLPAEYPSADATATTWKNDELQVSLVIPSAAWHVRGGEASFDVAVQLEKPAADARATLALIRRPMKNYAAFQKALVDIQTSAAGSPGYRPLQSKRLTVGPYTAYEIRFLKDADGRTSYNRLVSFYSKDMIYALSMSCPEERVADNDPDFEAFVLGLQITKTRDEIVPKGAPES